MGEDGFTFNFEGEGIRVFRIEKSDILEQLSRTSSSSFVFKKRLCFPRLVISKQSILLFVRSLQMTSAWILFPPAPTFQKFGFFASCTETTHANIFCFGIWLEIENNYILSKTDFLFSFILEFIGITIFSINKY